MVLRHVINKCSFASELNFFPMKKDITLYQDNAITKASYNMSALEKDILFLLISQMNKDDILHCNRFCANEF